MGTTLKNEIVQYGSNKSVALLGFDFTGQDWTLINTPQFLLGKQLVQKSFGYLIQQYNLIQNVCIY